MVRLVNEVRNDVNSNEPDVPSTYHPTRLFERAIKLITTPPFYICCYLQLLRYLKNHRHMCILSTGGTLDEGSAVSVNLLILEPIPLLSILIDIPGIKDAKVLTGDESNSLNALDFSTFRPEAENQQEVQILLSFDDCMVKAFN